MNDFLNGYASRSQLGPFDASELKELRPFHDFGSVRVPNRADLSIRLEVEESSQKVIAISLDLADSNVQIQAFAAPRNEGLWSEIRAALVSSIESQGGRALERLGSFGTELIAEVPSLSEEGVAIAARHLKFVGIDGPRWFLRLVVSGAALTDLAASGAVDEVIRGLVVNRGDIPMPPRELLSLSMPPGVNPIARN